MATNGSKEVTATARDAMRHAQERMSEGMNDLRDYAESADSAVREFARERPLLAIACAAALGFIIGRIASRT